MAEVEGDGFMKRCSTSTDVVSRSTPVSQVYMESGASVVVEASELACHTGGVEKEALSHPAQVEVEDCPRCTCNLFICIQWLSHGLSIQFVAGPVRFIAWLFVRLTPIFRCCSNVGFIVIAPLISRVQ